MKWNLLVWWYRHGAETLATFGTARLIKNSTGKIELCGGTFEDRVAAREWASLFLHEAII
jgi:hypothetical protein